MQSKKSIKKSQLNNQSINVVVWVTCCCFVKQLSNTRTYISRNKQHSTFVTTVDVRMCNVESKFWASTSCCFCAHVIVRRRNTNNSFILFCDVVRLKPIEALFTLFGVILIADSRCKCRKSFITKLLSDRYLMLSTCSGAASKICLLLYLWYDLVHCYMVFAFYAKQFMSLVFVLMTFEEKKSCLFRTLLEYKACVT